MIRDLADAIRDGLIVTDTENRVVHANERAARYFGLSVPDLVGRSVQDLIDPFALPLYEAHAALSRRGGTSRYELTLRRADGRPFRALAASRPLRDTRGQRVGDFTVVVALADREIAKTPFVPNRDPVQEILEHGALLLYAESPDRILTYLSPAARVLLGLAEDDATPARLHDLATDDPANREGLAHARSTVTTGESRPPYDLEIRRRDGQLVCVELREAPVVEQGQTIGIVGSLTDVTARRRRERLLALERDLGLALGEAQSAQEALRCTFETVLGVDEVDTAALHVVDPESGDLVLVGHRGLSEAFTQALARISVGTSRVTLVRRASGSGLEVVDEDARREGLTASLALPIRHAGQVLARLSVASRHVENFPAMAVTALQTITSHLGPIAYKFRAQTSLEASQATLRSLLSSAPAGIGLVRDRTFVWVNQHMVRLTGYPENELLGQSARFLYPDEEEFDRVGRVKYGQIEATGLGSLETRWKRRDGTLVDVVLSSAPLDPENVAAGTVFTAWDVTERNCTEDARLRLERQVQQAQKLESLGILAGGIAHDFNNILHAILGHAELAGVTLTDAESTRTHLVEIERAAGRAGELCRQMLAYSGRGSFVIERMHLGKVVSDLASMLEVSLSKKAELCVDVVGDQLPVAADTSQMQQVVMNLITNAAEAVGNEAGVVRVTVSSASYDAERLRVDFGQPWLEPGTYVTLKVEDTGCGMEPEMLDRMFEPFFTTKFAGRGLGLAAVQGILRGHQGGIRVSSELGQGTTVTVLLPPATGDIPARSVIDAAPPEVAARGAVLIADDELLVRELGQMMLTSAGFEVIAVEDGLSAVEAFRSKSAEIACVILDLTMPVMDGEEAFREVRRIRPSVPVILCSGFSEQELRARFDGDGPAGFLEKPFTKDALLGLLARVTTLAPR